MTEAELYLNPDHYVWAKEFCRIAKEIHFNPEKDEDWVATWIAKAMMRGVDRTTCQLGAFKFAHEIGANIGAV